METVLLVLLFLLLGLAAFVGFSIRRHAHEVERNLLATAARQTTAQEPA